MVQHDCAIPEPDISKRSTHGRVIAGRSSSGYPWSGHQHSMLQFPSIRRDILNNTFQNRVLANN